MYQIDTLVETVDYTIDNKRRRHIVGGFLISLSLFLAGLAVTTITLKEDTDEYEDD